MGFNMKNQLTKKEESTVGVLGKYGLGDIIKPLIQEVYLFDTFIAGTTHLEDQTVLEALRPGEKLTLLREENNEFDKKAILFLNAEKKKLGYVPKRDNIVCARLMDAGKLLNAKITGIEQRTHYKMIRVAIYLVDL
jgi:hypothetical protein